MSFPEVKYPHSKYTIHSDEVTSRIAWLLKPDGTKVKFTYPMKGIYFKILGLWARYLKTCKESCGRVKPCKVTVNGIASLLGMDRKTVREAIHILEEVGVISFLESEEAGSPTGRTLLKIAPLHTVEDGSNVIHSIWWYGLDNNGKTFSEWRV